MIASVRRALAYFRPDAGRVTLSLVLIVVVNLLGLLAPVPLALFFTVMAGDAVDWSKWANRPFEWVTLDKSVHMVLVLAGVTLALRVVSEVLRLVQGQLSIAVGYAGRSRAQAELFQKLQALSLHYHRSQPQGDALYRIGSDVSGVQGLLTLGVNTLVNLTLLLVMLALMLNLHWKLTLVALAVVPPMMLVITQWGHRLYRYSLAQREADQSVTTQVQRSLATVGLVQAFVRERDEAQRFDARVSRYVSASLKLHWQELLYWLVLSLIIALGSVGLFAYGGALVVRGELKVGVLFLFITYLGQLYDPLNKLSSTNSGLQGALAGANRVFEVLDQDPIIRDASGAQHLAVQPRTLALENVSFRYKTDGAPTLRNVSVTIAPGKMVAFVGPSGQGKTTLLNLLPRFYDPTDGRVTLDGVDLRSVRVADVRRHVALVLQENPILPATVAENIAYGRPDATAADVRAAAELAGADEFVAKLDDGYDALISESGTNLSGGQRQRIAIARALCTRAPILVLDEPTSALDAQTEQHVVDALARLKGRRTTVVVSHRLSTVIDCDEIHVLRAGEIVESGTHAELVARRGAYYEMAKHQLRLDDA